MSGKYKNLYVLGDSLSDIGALTGILSNLSYSSGVKFDEPFYKNRSFSDGPVAAEYVAQFLNLKEFEPGWKYSFFGKEYEQRGQNYAVSYATAAEYSTLLHSYFFNEFCLANQLNALIKHNSNIGSEDLVIITIGGNDIMCAYTHESNKAQEEILNKAVSEICNALRVLSEHGVQHIVVANAPDIGLIPAFNKNKEASKLVTELTNSFNEKLASGLEEVKEDCPDLRVKQLDLYSKMNELIDEYKNNGLNYQDACISNIADGVDGFMDTVSTLFDLIFAGKLESQYNPGCSEEMLENYFFFDYFHPTGEPHRQLGEEICELIGV